MIDNNPEQFFSALKQVRMQSSEKSALRHVLAAFTQSYRPTPSVFGFLMKHAAALSVLALVLVLGGTAVTAHDSLPGSPFYAWKTEVNDRIALATATDEDARLDAELRQIERALSDEERALVHESVLREDPTPTPTSTAPAVRFDDDAEREIRDLERELKDLEREEVPEL